MHNLARLFEVSRKSSSHPMEGLRGVAVFLVFMVHYVTIIAPWTPASSVSAGEAIYTIGLTGVDLFFVLSGFLIYGSLIANPQPFWSFLGRRAQRIYPAFLVVFAVYVTLSYIFPADSRIPDDPLAAVLYLAQNALLMPGFFPIEPLIMVAWSLSYEMMFYLTAPLLIGWMALRSCPQQTRAALIAIAAACCLLLFEGQYQRIIMFCAGMAVYELTRSKWRAPPALAAMLAALLGLGAYLLPLPTELRRVALFAGFTIACWHCVTIPSWLARALSWSPLRWFGNMSYSYYLLHGLVLKFTFLVVGMLVPKGVNLTGWMLLPAFVATLIPSAALYLAVERPISLQPTRVAAGSRPRSSVASPNGQKEEVQRVAQR
jgi:peptidoglycan/LPS O-acetylase OafA/YrhL